MSFRVIQNIHSTNRFCVTFLHESFDKILNIMEKIVFEYMIFPLFWLILISSICLNYVKPFFVDGQ